MNENPHQLLLEQRLPRWTHHATTDQWQTLREALKPAQDLPDREATWFANAARDLREAVLASQARLAHSQQALARSLKGLRQITEFCEPLLQARLAQHGSVAPVRGTELLRVQRTWSWLGSVFQYSSERHSLLQAALLNFAVDETFDNHSALAAPDDIHVRDITIEGTAPGSYDTPGANFPLPSQAYQVKALPLGPQAFADLCRELDLGQRYQEHLQGMFDGKANVQRRALAITVLRDRLRLAADLGYLNHTLDAVDHALVQRLLDGSAPPCRTLELFGLAVHEVLVIDNGTSGHLLYLPGHSPALRHCKDRPAVADALAELLLEPAARQRFCDYLPLDLRAQFLDVLAQNLDASGQGASDQTWVRARQANLHLTWKTIDSELFGFMQDRHVARIKAEARLLAVPTADADEQARKRRLEQWQSLGLDMLTVAGFFVPGVGTLLLAVTACQLLGEAYEGYEAWSVGDRHLALQHLEAVGLNLAVLGGLHVAGKVLPKLFNSPLMENLDPVNSADGQRRLWQPDLAPYRSPVVLPEGLQANAQGQFEMQGRSFIRIDGHLHEQRLDLRLKRWRIVHPEDDQAYQPLLEHNDEGAWRAEHEQPQDWSLIYLLRRLGPDFDGFTDTELHRAAQVCGLSEDALRQVHLQGRPVPALLPDTLARLRAEQQALAQMARDPALDHSALFHNLYDPITPPDPLSQRLLQAHSRLTRPLARRLLTRLTPGERTTAAASGQLPAWLTQAAEQVASDLPLARALEGLWLGRLATADSERLLLSCLERLPGWSDKVRLELRAGSAQGPVLRAIGASEAAEHGIVIKASSGYEAYRGDLPAPGLQDHDLCRAVLAALRKVRRHALGLAGEDADKLRKSVFAQVNADRQGTTWRLWGNTQQRWQGGALAGGDTTSVYPQLSLRGSQLGRYRRVYPSASVTSFHNQRLRWLRAGRPVEIELDRLHERLQNLRDELAAWAGASAGRQRAIAPLVRAWRRDSITTLEHGEPVHTLDLRGLALDNEAIASLALPDDFKHIQELELSDNGPLSELHPEFLERFPRLERLYLRNNRLARLPMLARPLRLLSLDLQGNRITWDDLAQRQLERSANLIKLDISDNPLLRAPALGNLVQLQTVHLNSASLTQLPTGLAALGRAEVLDLSDNQFTSLPAGLVLPEPVGRALELESNWLTDDLREQIDAYHQQHGIDLLVADYQYEELLEGTTPEQRQLWQRLPLNYRRKLRAILVDDTYLSDPEGMHDEIWRRLQRIDEDPDLRRYALSWPAADLLALDIP
ncbi:dermonecrotic toxin domain-containing protein [Pseudomonas sp. UFMG81]|uniref:dermonecrotic toxin domain-containing protein n=1 Tax=Pseudomonas sp. UFMG81 TaxID=2745936 RepID=UPI00188FBA8A|nr:DUF6543 domain-containing protein [Pseudomonas sp. UFMG81]